MPFDVHANQDLRTGAGPSMGRVCCHSNHWGCPKGSGCEELGQEGGAALSANILTIFGAPCHWLVLVLWGQLWLPVCHTDPQGRLWLTPVF